MGAIDKTTLKDAFTKFWTEFLKPWSSKEKIKIVIPIPDNNLSLLLSSFANACLYGRQYTRPEFAVAKEIFNQLYKLAGDVITSHDVNYDNQTWDNACRNFLQYCSDTAEKTENDKFWVDFALYITNILDDEGYFYPVEATA